MNTKSKKANGTNSIYQTKDGRWTAQIVIGKTETGKLKYKRFSSKKQSEVISKMKAYEKSFTRATNAEECYIGDYLKGYLENVKINQLKPTSYDRDYCTYQLINKYIGTYEMGAITSEFINKQLIDALKRDKYSFSTTHKALVLLNQCYNYAIKNGKLTHNPCTFVERPSRKTYSTKKIRFLTIEEVKIFKEQAIKTYENNKPRYTYGALACLDIYTGLRGGELIALKWSDIDLINKVLHVQKNIVAKYNYDTNGKKNRQLIEQDGTKTSEGRTIPLNNQAIECIAKIKEVTPPKDANSYLATGSEKMISISEINQTYSTIAKACGIERPLGIHTLRHTFASLMIKKGVDIKVLSEILGHKDVAFTYNIYVHIISEQKAKAIKLLDLD